MVDEKILNEEQYKAVTHEKGPLLIIAGAGTGKTTVVTERIKHLILEKGISPSEILALTFTEKAAAEMEERVDVAMPYGYSQMWISTFHAFCDRILRDEAIHIGLNPSYSLTTEAGSILFLRKNLFKFKLKYFRPLGNPTKFISGMLQHFSRLKDEDIGVEEYIAYAEKLAEKKDVEKDEVTKTLELAYAYKTYEELKIQEGVMDFSDLIANVLKLFRSRKNMLKTYQDKFKYILLDEFQDTNFAQNTLAILLAGTKKNITVVGDDDQAIYRWRGAAISNMIQFRKHFPDSKIITLTRNYRSTHEILNTSYRLIQQNNPDRLEVKENINKKLQSMRNIKGTSVEFIFSDRVENEAEELVKVIKKLTRNKKYTYKDFAILVRANDHSQPFVRALSRAHIPYQFLGPGKLFHQEEIKDLIAYLKILYNFDDSTSLYRVLSLPIFKLDTRDIAALLNLGRRKNYTLFETLEKVANPTQEAIDVSLTADTREKLLKIYQMIKKHLQKVSHDSAGQILYFFLQDSGILQEFVNPQKELDEKKSQNIARFFEKLKSYEAENEDASIFAVVDWIDLSMQLGESPLATDIDWTENNAVNILTIHSSKGLEFPVVFLVNLVSQRFPTRERKEQIPIPQDLIKEILPTGDHHLQEERRLFYVGMTRARDSLFLTAANYYGEGKRERKISPFVYESLGEEKTNTLLNIHKSKKHVIQPSLLEWAFPDEKLLQEKKSSSDSFTRQALSKITYVSYSQLQTFDLCPLHYKLRYILKIPPIISSAQSFGTSIHSALREFYFRFTKGERVSVDIIPEVVEKTWANEGYTSKQHEQEAKKHAQYLITTYIKKYFNEKANSKDVLLETPFQFYVSVPSSSRSGVKIGGRIDRIDILDKGKIEIIDYKTGTNIPSEKELQDNLQLTVYALAATHVNELNLNKKPEDVLLSLYYLEEDKKFTTTRTPEQLEEAKITILEKAEKIEQSDFLCSGSSFCLTCEYKMLCSAKS